MSTEAAVPKSEIAVMCWRRESCALFHGACKVPGHMWLQKELAYQCFAAVGSCWGWGTRKVEPVQHFQVYRRFNRVEGCWLQRWEGVELR